MNTSTSDAKAPPTQKVPFLVKLGYSFGTLGKSIAYNLFYVYFLLFLTAVVGLDPAIAGTISLVAIIWDGITDPLVGYLSDNSRNRAGRRRPFILRFCAPLAAVLVLLFTVFPDLSGPAQVFYFLLMNVLFWTMFTLVDVPYIALGGELSDDGNERTQIRTMATMWNFVGFVVVAAGTVPLVVSLADPVGYPGEKAFADPGAWGKVVIAFGLLVLVAFLVAHVATRGRETTVPQKDSATRAGFIGDYLSIMRIREFHPLIGFNVISQIGGYMLTALAVHYFIYHMGASESQISTIFLVYGIIVVAISPLIGGAANRFGKKPVLIACNGINVLIFLYFWQAGFNFTNVYLSTAGIGLYFGSFYILAIAATYDIAELDKVRRNDRESRQGIIFAFFSFMMKIGVGLGMFFSGLLLKATGFDPTAAQQSERALWGLHLGFTLIPAILFLLGIAILSRYPISRARQVQIDDEVKMLDAAG